MPFFRFDGSCSKELYDNTYERFEKLYPEVNQNSDTGISGDGSISNFPDNMYQGWLDRQSAIRALHNDWDRIFNEEAEKLERRKKAEDEETKKQQEAERTQKELEKKRQKNFSSLVDEESTASLVESCPLKDKNEQDNDCTFESYSISFEYDAAKGQPLRGPFEFKKDAKDKVVETVCGFEDKYAIATIKVNDITKKKCAIPFRKQHFPNRMFDTSALEDEHILHQTEDTLKIKVFSEKMERPITGGVAGILDNYSQFLVWNYKPKPVCIPINTCGRKEVVEIRAYRDTNLNGYIKLGASQEETKAWNTKSKSFDLSSKLRILGPTFHGKIIYDSTELAFEVGFKTEGNKLKKICELASKVFDVAQQIGAETSPPGLKFSLIYPNLMLAVSDSSGYRFVRMERWR